MAPRVLSPMTLNAVGLVSVVLPEAVNDVLPKLAVAPLGNPLRFGQWLLVTHTSDLLAYPFGGRRGGSILTAICCLAGLIALLWLLLRAVTLGVALLRATEDAFVRSIAAGIVGGLLGQICASVLGDYLIPAYHNGGHTNFCATVYTWMMIGLLVAIETGARKRPLAATLR